jgi:hypothetical protein
MTMRSTIDSSPPLPVVRKPLLARPSLRMSAAGLLLSLQLAAQAAGPGASAGTVVWRCDLDGKAIYTDSPCAGGRGLTIDDSRSAAQTAQARQRTRALVAEARQLETERARREAAYRPGAGLSGFLHSPLQASSLTPPAAVSPPQRASRRPGDRPSGDRLSPAAAHATRGGRG